MANTLFPADALKATYAGCCGNRAVFTNKAAVAAASLTTSGAGDKVNLVYVPAGTLVDRVVVKNTDLDSNGTPTLAINLGFAHVDGTAATTAETADATARSLTVATLVAAAATTWNAAATTTYEIFPPFKVEKDSYLQAVTTAVAATGAAGTVYAKVEGEALGAA